MRILLLIISIFAYTTSYARGWGYDTPKGRLEVEYITSEIVKVTFSTDKQNADNNTGVCVNRELPSIVVKTTTQKDGRVVMQSKDLIVEFDTKNHSLTFIDKKTGKVLLAERKTEAHEVEKVVQERIIYDEKSAHVEETANGKVTVKDEIRRDTIGQSWRYRTHFDWNNENEALYGLGAHMEDYMNLHGKTMYLTQHNLKAMIPMLSSTNGYGLLFDAGCAMKMEDNCIEMEAAKQMCYYFIKGENLDKIVAGYRYLTGDCPMMPRYMFGYTQSKERYVSSDDLIRTLAEYRRRHVPIDMIVQDWNYWPQGWGYMKMDSRFYPDPKALADSIHAMNAKLMVSIWPNPQWCPEAEDFKKRGMMLEHDVYDVFSPEARKHYWSYANNEFFSKGFDAWWCDSSEPLDGDWNKVPAPVNGKAYGWGDNERRWHLNQDVLSDALGAERSSLYSLYHAMGIYENQRATTSEKRVLNLTRSSYAGQQRFATITWNGDTHASWESFQQQIPASLNFMATGCPYWTVDIGSFFTRSDGRWFYKGEFPKGVADDNYKEYYTRMFQWGTFLPMLRSHGSDTPREIWRFGEPGTKYYDAILKMINLRYELIPYLYSLAGWTTFNNYTMARMLAFDFADDEKVLDIKDEYMLGPAFLVCPVTKAGATSREVYLPKGATWIDYWTGKRYDGGQTLTASAAIDKLPLFVRAGSIVPTAPVTEYAAAQQDKPFTINIYSGKDCDFVLYEDEGDNYNYESGKYTEIPLKWNERKHILTIGSRKGSYANMQTDRIFKVSINGGAVKEIHYNGNLIKTKF